MGETKKKFLCVENGDKFIIEAKDMVEAKELVKIWNGSVIHEIKII